MKNKIKFAIFNIFLFFIIINTAAGESLQYDKKIDLHLKQKLQSKTEVEALIYLSPEPNLNQAFLIKNKNKRSHFVFNELVRNAVTSQHSVISWLKKNKIAFKAYYIENVIFIKTANLSTLNQIAKMQYVERVTHNAQSALVLPKVVDPLQWGAPSVNSMPGHISRIGADRVWNELGVKGKGIVIGGHDTGYFWQHNAIRRQYRGFKNGSADHNYNWHDSFDSTLEPFDDGDHGTHTMGTILGDDGGVNKIGIAPEAQWIGCRNMKGGYGTVASYLECFEFFLAPYPLGGDSRKDGRPDLAPNIVNNSWACTQKEGCRGDELLKSVQNLKAAGIMNIVAAGNEGPNCSTISEPPAHYAGDVVSVGAYNRYMNEAASFSSRGPSLFNNLISPTLTAYGDIIRSSVSKSPDAYDDKAGTSMASPQVAGVVALIWSARPELIGEIDRTIEILKKSAQPLTSRETCGGVSGTKIPNNTFGYGMVDAYKAVTTY